MIEKDYRISMISRGLQFEIIKQSSKSKKSRFRQYKLTQGREISGLAAYE